jgi:hypothetical protein
MLTLAFSVMTPYRPLDVVSEILVSYLLISLYWIELFELASLINSALSIVILTLSAPQTIVGSRYGKSLKS